MAAYDAGMTREARTIAIGAPHHITQRGNNCQDVFFVDEDRDHYLSLLKLQAEQYGLIVHGYCLMTNHVHIVATPEDEHSLAKGIGRTHYFYTRYVNKLHGRSGHLWQNRFFSCPLDEDHFLDAVRYAERNPVRAKMVRKPWGYPWSSANAHIAGHDPLQLLSFAEWPSRYKGDRWKTLLEGVEDESMVGTIRTSTFKGVPLGSDRFISKLETRLGRRLRPLPVGRPRKKKKTAKKGRKYY